MLEKALFVAKLFLDCREKLLSEDGFCVILKKFGHGCRTDNVLKGCEWIPLIWPVKGPCGLMDKASASEAGDCGFKSHLGRF